LGDDRLGGWEIEHDKVYKIVLVGWFMLDVKFVRENVDVVKANMTRKGRGDLGIVGYGF